MSAVLTKLVPAAVAAAMEANSVELWRICCGHLPGAEFHDDEQLTWFVTGRPSAPWLNQVMVARLGSDGLTDAIDGTLAPFRAQRLPMLWSVGPSTRPVDLGAHLERHGLVAEGTMTAMAVRLDALVQQISTPSGFTIEPVENIEMLDKWADAYIRGFEMPEVDGRVLRDAYAHIGFDQSVPFRHYVGLLHGEPVASSTLFVGGGVAGIFHVGTVPTARRQGMGAAMTLAPLRDARTLGYRIGTLYSAASAMGINVYRRLGFRQYGALAQYRWPGER